LFTSWLKALNCLRNTCAHHARVWNRSLTDTLKQMTDWQVREPLHHLCGGAPTKSIYSALAIAAYLVTEIDPDSDWSTKARQHLLNFPDVPHLVPTVQMGLPPDWQEESLWR
jgi:abortive infection bacteriophage resistance protein